MSALRKVSPAVQHSAPRRVFLSAIAGAPALALLSGNAGAVSAVDAAVIAKAANVRRLILAFAAADRRSERADRAYVAAMRELGPRPHLVAEIAAWNAAHATIVDRLDMKALEDEADVACDAMEDAMKELAALQVASHRGIAAKASIFKRPEPFDAENFAHQKMATAIMRDLGCEIAGGADV